MCPTHSSIQFTCICSQIDVPSPSLVLVSVCKNVSVLSGLCQAHIRNKTTISEFQLQISLSDIVIRTVMMALVLLYEFQPFEVHAKFICFSSVEISVFWQVDNTNQTLPVSAVPKNV